MTNTTSQIHSALKGFYTWLISKGSSSVVLRCFSTPDICPQRDFKDFSWTPEIDSSFSSAKSALALVPALVHPNSSAKISLAVDALDSHMGVVFQQLVGGSWAPLAFFSKKLSSTLSHYTVFVR